METNSAISIEPVYKHFVRRAGRRMSTSSLKYDTHYKFDVFNSKNSPNLDIRSHHRVLNAESLTLKHTE